MISVTFEFDKTTKNTVRFIEVNNDAELDKVVGMIYISKEACDDLLEDSGFDSYEDLTINVAIEAE